jgi:hypothetical protein
MLMTNGRSQPQHSCDPRSCVKFQIDRDRAGPPGGSPTAAQTHIRPSARLVEMPPPTTVTKRIVAFQKRFVGADNRLSRTASAQ